MVFIPALPLTLNSTFDLFFSIVVYFGLFSFGVNLLVRILTRS